VDTERFRSAFWHPRNDYDSGGDAALYWRRVGAELGRDFDEAQIAELIEREIAFWSNFDQRVLAWTKQLKSAGLQTSMLSNLPLTLGERLRAIPGFLDHFDQITFSYEVGVIKPHPAIYKHAVNGLGIRPGEGLFLDDRTDNVEGARETGLKAEVFSTWERFVEDHARKHDLPMPAL
jgi:putative hydrolase of the HAD superfamily